MDKTRYLISALFCVPSNAGRYLLPLTVLLRTTKHRYLCQVHPFCGFEAMRHKLNVFEGADVGVSLACRQNISLSNVYCELNVPPCASVEESLENARLDVETMVAVPTKRRRNSGCAATSLPPELLSYVFSMNVLSDRPQLKKGNNSLGWVSATHVCHRWREVCAATYQPAYVYAYDGASDRARNAHTLEISGLDLHVAKVVFGIIGSIRQLFPRGRAKDCWLSGSTPFSNFPGRRAGTRETRVLESTYGSAFGSKLANETPCRFTHTFPTTVSSTAGISGNTTHVMGTRDDQLSYIPSA